jgi:hypothetical protein
MARSTARLLNRSGGNRICACSRKCARLRFEQAHHRVVDGHQRVLRAQLRDGVRMLVEIAVEIDDARPPQRLHRPINVRPVFDQDRYRRRQKELAFRRR